MTNKLDPRQLAELYASSDSVESTDDLIERLCTDRDVLDIGCASYAGEQGFGATHALVLARARSCVGIDISDAVLSLPKSDKAEYLVANAETFVHPTRRFDTIYVGDAVEHFSNGGLFLECAAKMLNPGGRVVLVTPNAYGVRCFATLLTDFEPAVHPEHTCFFSVKTLNELVSRHGFRIAKLHYVRGQALDAGDRPLRRGYKLAYRALTSIAGLRKLSDTFAVEIVRD